MKFKANFVLRPSKALKSGLINLECCIVLNNRRFYHRLPRQLTLKEWNHAKQEVRGKTVEATEVNNFINVYKQHLFSLQSKIIQEGLPYSIDTFKNLIQGKEEQKNITILQLYAEHNKDYEALKNKKQISYASYQRHNTTRLHLKQYLKEKYDKSDVLLKNINKSFIDGFYNFLRTKKNIQHNTTINYMKNLKKIVLIAFHNNMITRNPFHGYKLSLNKVDIDFLTLKEIETIYKKQFATDRLNHIKDVFIFACFTGLAYIDCKNFDYKKHLKIDDQGNSFIIKARQKTNIISTVPLLPIAKEILEHYHYKLPIPSNQRVNEYLKEIISICKINKNIHFHCARHSFATSITLNNGVSLTSVSKMLGHANVNITQRYAKVLNTMLIDDRDRIIEKIKF